MLFRSGERRDLHEVDVLLLGEPQRLADGHDAELLAILAYEAYVGGRDLAVDPMRTLFSFAVSRV